MIPTPPKRTFEIHYQLWPGEPDPTTEVVRVEGVSSVKACQALVERLGSLKVKMVYEVR